MEEIMEWQPIETAPKDNRILVWNGKDMFVVHHGINWITGDVAYIVAQWDNKTNQVLTRPTHWMPLPPAPKLD